MSSSISLARVIVDCSGTNLPQLPSFVPLVRDATEVYLDLSKNGLTSMTGAGEKIRNYSRVVQLDLSYNQVNCTAIICPELCFKHTQGRVQN